MKIMNLNRLILLLLFVLTPVSYAEVSQPKLISMTASQQGALGIRSESIMPAESAWNTPHPAKVMVPNSQLRVISAPLSGLLESLLVAEGEEVKKGQPLAVIHSPQLLQQQSAYLEAITDLNLANTEKKRDAELFEEGIIAKRRYLESSAKYSQLKTRAEQHRQTLKLAGMSNNALATLKRSRDISSSLKIQAPLSGVVLEQLVTPGGQMNALDPIYKVGHLEPLWLEIHVPLEQLGDVKKGAEIKVVEPDIIGKVITVGRMVHGADQGVLIRAEIHDGAALLRPGQFVQAQIADTSSGNDQAFRIPRAALVRNEGKTWVLIARENGFLPVAIEIIKEEASHLVINGELLATDKTVVAGTAALKAAWLEGAE